MPREIQTTVFLVAAPAILVAAALACHRWLPEAETTDHALDPEATATSPMHAPASPDPEVVVVKARDHTVRIASTQGVRTFTVEAADGRVLAERIDGTAFRAKFPSVWQELEHATGVDQGIRRTVDPLPNL